MRPDTLYVITEVAGQGNDLLPLWTGLLGGILGILGTFWASRASIQVAGAQIRAQQESTTQQLRATVVAANRIRWIDQLRTEIASFAALVMGIATDLSVGADSKSVHSKIDEANQRIATVSLLLNFTEPESQSVDAAMRDSAAHIAGLLKRPVSPADVDEAESKVRNLEERTRRVLKNEWTRVKELT